MKRFLALLLALLLIACLAGCGSGSNDDKFYKKSDPIQVVDGAGRHVSFAGPVKTVATSWGGTCDPYLFALGVQDRLVATNAKNDFHQMLIQNMGDMKSVGRWALDREALAALSPDLFIHGLGGLENIKNANKVGVRGIALSLNRFEDVKNNITVLGSVFGVEERAERVNLCCDRILALVDERVASIPEDQRVTVVVLGEETGTVACDVYNTMEEMVRHAGGISVVPADIAAKTDFTNVGLETIFKWDADFTFLQSNWGELTDEQILADPAWENLSSVKNGHVYAIPSLADSWAIATPSCYLGVLYMSMQMYPELYSDIDYEQTVLDFYREVYDLDTTRDVLGF